MLDYCLGSGALCGQLLLPSQAVIHLWEPLGTCWQTFCARFVYFNALYNFTIWCFIVKNAQSEWIGCYETYPLLLLKMLLSVLMPSYKHIIQHYNMQLVSFFFVVSWSEMSFWL